jgi:hypothetical protein
LGGGFFTGIEPNLGRAQHLYSIEQSLRDALLCLGLGAAVELCKVSES